MSKVLASSFVSFNLNGEIDLATTTEAFEAWVVAHADDLQAEHAAQAATSAAYDTAARAVFAVYLKIGKDNVKIVDLVDGIAGIIFPANDPTTMVERGLAKPLIKAHIEGSPLYRTGNRGRNGGVSLV